MRTEAMEYYGLVRSLRSAGYYETAHHKVTLPLILWTPDQAA